MARLVALSRETKETSIELSLDLDSREAPRLELEGVPFFLHLLTAMSFHGGFFLQIKASGDIDVDPHHLVEDIGLVFGDALFRVSTDFGPVRRFAHRVIPMDDALSEVTVDTAGRPFLVYTADYPQARAGDFPLCLIDEFLTALCGRGRITLHAHCRYGKNSHHMAESLFKALGKAIGGAYALISPGFGTPSTKGIL
jgi:imidazoleglycerol-phosphate dehydratase